MATKKKTTGRGKALPTPEKPEQATAIAKLMAMREKKFDGFRPSEMANADDIEKFTKYLGMIDLCHQWALGRPGYAMGRIMHLLGKEGAGKTSKMYQILRLAFDAGGLGAMVETEYALSNEQARSYLGPHYGTFKDLFHQPDSFQRGLDMMMRYLDLFEEIDRDGLLPKVLVYDSVAGSGTDAVVADTYKVGDVAGGISEKARVFRDVLEHMKPKLKRTNTLLILGNHGKVAIETGSGPKVKRAEIDMINGQGGRAIDFNSTYWEYVKRGANIKDPDGGKAGFTTLSTFRKNKVRFPGRQYSVDVMFEEGMVYVPHTIKVLANSGICGVRKLPGGYYCCEEIGIPESSKVRARDLYEAIHSPENIGRFIAEIDILMPPVPGNVHYPDSWGGREPVLPSDKDGPRADLGETIAIGNEDEVEMEPDAEA